MTATCTGGCTWDTEATWPSAKRRTRTWWSPPALSPFGEDHSFPLPVDLIRYAHPTDKPNRAGVQLVEGR
jgi:hypothetical protein